MAYATVTIFFETTDKAEAEARIASWILHEGCSVSASFSDIIPPTPGMTDAGGVIQAAPDLVETASDA